MESQSRTSKKRQDASDHLFHRLLRPVRRLSCDFSYDENFAMNVVQTSLGPLPFVLTPDGRNGTKTIGDTGGED